MSIYIGNNKYKEIYLGSNKISEVYLGSNKIFAEPKYKDRYEFTLFESSNGNGVSSGTVSDAFANYDEIGIRLRFDNFAINGGNWMWFNDAAFKTSSGSYWVYYITNDDTNFRLVEVKFEFNGTNFTVSVPNNYGWNIYTDMDSNARMYCNTSASILNIVSKIVGVKYQ